MNVKTIWTIFMIAIAAKITYFVTARNTSGLTLHEMEKFIESIENVTSVRNNRISKRQTNNGPQLPITVIPPALVNGPEVASAIRFERYSFPFIIAARIGPFTFSCDQQNGNLNVATQLPGGGTNVQSQNAEFFYHPLPGLWWFVKCVSMETGGSSLDVTGVSKPGGDSGIDPNALKSLVG